LFAFSGDKKETILSLQHGKHKGEE
jgi:hypothetical protein